MKYTVAASVAMAALASAAPLNNQYYSTTTQEVWETVWSTTTIWVDPTEVAVARPTSVGGFYEVSEGRASTSSAASSSTSSYSAPAAAVVIPSSTSAAPAPTSTSVYVAPAPTSSYVAPYVAPVVSSTTVAPVAPASTPVYVAPAAVSSAPAPVQASTSTSTTGTHTGDMTYYDVSVGLTSCGLTGSNSDFLVAMNAPDMANGANPNNNVHCNKMINIYYNGVGPIQGKVVDTCPECVSGAIDVTDSLFKKIAPNGDGRVKGVSWSWA